MNNSNTYQQGVKVVKLTKKEIEVLLERSVDGLADWAEVQLGIHYDVAVEKAEQLHEHLNFHSGVDLDVLTITQKSMLVDMIEGSTVPGSTVSGSPWHRSSIRTLKSVASKLMAEGDPCIGEIEVPIY